MLPYSRTDTWHRVSQALNLTSDNSLIRNHPVTEFHNSNGDLRGGKRDLYEGGIRVPLIALWPGTVPAETVSDHVCAVWDLLPTFCEMAGIPVPADRDGISILPALTGKTQPPPEFLYWEYHTPQRMQAVRMGDWKGIRLNADIDASAPIELYNLADDVGETKDVAVKNPKVVARISEIMKAEHQASGIFPFKREKRN